MEHIMKLYESNFNDLKIGKKREYRLNDDKRKQIRLGDTIKFLKLPNLDKDFKYDYENIEAVVQDTYDGGYYTKEESEKNGSIVFTIEKKSDTSM